jgi:hypothetical protein
MDQLFSQMSQQIQSAPPPPSMPEPQTPDIGLLLLSSILSNAGSALSGNPVYSAQNARYLEDTREAPMRVRMANNQAELKASQEKQEQLRGVALKRIEFQQDQLQGYMQDEKKFEQFIKLEAAKDKIYRERRKYFEELDQETFAKNEAERRITAGVRGEESRKTVAANRSGTKGGKVNSKLRPMLQGINKEETNDIKMLDESYRAANKRDKDDQKALARNRTTWAKLRKERIAFWQGLRERKTSEAQPK